MNDKQTRYFVLTCALAVLLYWMSKPKHDISNSANAPVDESSDFIQDPNLQAYSPSNAPQPMNPNISVNVANQGLSYLNNNYIPLFGFIGMAQGEYFH